MASDIVHGKQVKAIRKAQKEKQNKEKKERLEAAKKPSFIPLPSIQIQGNAFENEENFIKFDMTDLTEEEHQALSISAPQQRTPQVQRDNRGTKRKFESTPEKKYKSVDILSPLPSPPWCHEKSYSDRAIKMYFFSFPVRVLLILG